MGTDHLLELVLTLLILPASYKWFTIYLKEKAEKHKASIEEVAVGKVLEEIVEVVVGLKQDVNTTHYVSLDILKKLTDKEDEDALKKKIKDMMKEQQDG